MVNNLNYNGYIMLIPKKVNTVLFNALDWKYKAKNDSYDNTK